MATTQQERLSAALPHMKVVEGESPWMYLDTYGNVTVGIGALITPDEAIQLPFHIPAGTMATAQQIRAEFARVQAMRPGMFYMAYRRPDSLILSEQAMESKCVADMKMFDEELVKQFAEDYTAAPLPAALAILDMAYNLGMSKFLHLFTHLCAAIVRHDWVTAAAESHRNGIAASRNDWTRNQFLEAASLSTKGNA